MLKVDPQARRPDTAGTGKLGIALGRLFSWLRDLIATKLAGLGVTPNAITLAGLFLAVAVAVCFALGASHAPPWESGPGPKSWWVFAGAWIMLFSGIMDMLDGAIARIGGTGSTFGGFFDSTIDRLSDFVIFLGCSLHFAALGNVTYVALSFSALAASFMISYTKARGDDFVKMRSVGYWQRGERYGIVMGIAVVGHAPAMLWLLGTAPWLTFWRRVVHVKRRLDGEPDDAPSPLRRNTFLYDAFTIGCLVFGLVAPWIAPLFTGAADPLGAIFRG